MKIVEKFPTTYAWNLQLKDKLGVSKLPPIVGQCVVGTPLLLVTSHELLKDLYVNKTQFVTRPESATLAWKKVMKSAVIWGQSMDPVYQRKRKVLSSSFFKSKLLGMTKIMKKVALDEIKNLQKVGNDGIIDGPSFTLDLQSHMILDCCCGEGFSKILCDYETPNGIEQRPMYQCLD